MVKMTTHQYLEIEMAEMKTDIKYIKKSLDENKIEHHQLLKKHDSLVSKIDSYIDSTEDKLQNKADKIEVENIRKFMNSKIVGGLIFIVMLLISIIGFLAEKTLF